MSLNLRNDLVLAISAEVLKTPSGFLTDDMLRLNQGFFPDFAAICRSTHEEFIIARQVCSLAYLFPFSIYNINISLSTRNSRLFIVLMCMHVAFDQDFIHLRFSAFIEVIKKDIHEIKKIIDKRYFWQSK